MIAPDDPRHGTHRGYAASCRRGHCPLPEKIDCTHAHSIYLNLWRSGRTERLVDPTGMRRRIQALMVMGWSAESIGEQLGLNADAVRLLMRRSTTRCRASSARRVAELYDRISMIFGPSPLVRARSLSKGWLPPLAWDDIDNDAEPPAVDNVCRLRSEIDEVVVLRAMQGHHVRANRAERLEVIRRWEAAGRARNELERLQGWGIWRDLRAVAA